MIKKLQHLSFAFILFFAWQTKIWGQAVYYYGPQGKTSLSISKEKVFVKFKADLSQKDRQKLASTFQATSNLRQENAVGDLAFIPLNASWVRLDAKEKTDRLRATPGVSWSSPVLVSLDGEEIAIGPKVIVKLKSSVDLISLQMLVAQYKNATLRQDEFLPLIYYIDLPQENALNILNIANTLAETKQYAWAVPDFYKKLKKSNSDDPFYPGQWHLNNTGQALRGGIKGKSDADIDAPEAWGITRGSSSIKIAIIDEGVDLNHPDLKANLLPGYDATGRGSAGAPEGDDAHGTACAGIVAALGNNKIGGTGIAPNCKIIPVRIAYSDADGDWITSDEMIANAINWAWKVGKADILSNSWGGGSLSFVEKEAIDAAVSEGRNGKGCPVLFSAGNDNREVSYPAAYSNSIAVGAANMCDERKRSSNKVGDLGERVLPDLLGVSCDQEKSWGSNFGANLDIAAPSPMIITTDISGGTGYVEGDYSYFNGTSAACPVAAGVMALILSVNPNLSEKDARFILESTCEKVGGYSYKDNISQPNGTWCSDLGYGRINAHQAVLKARNYVGQQIDYELSLYSALEVSPNPSNIGSTINVKFNLLNTGEQEFAGSLGVALFTEQGDFVEFMREYTVNSLPVNYRFTNDISFDYQNLKPKGRFQIAVFFLPKNGQQWILVEPGNFDNVITWLNGYGLNSNCTIPSLIKVTATGYSHFSLSWQEVPGIKNYEIRYRKQGTVDWVELPNWSSTSHVSSNKSPCTTYEWQIRSVCASSVGDWSAVQLIKTEGCGDPYCYSYGIASRSFIKEVNIGTLRVSSSTDYGYANRTSSVINAVAGTTLPVKLTPGRSSEESLQEVYWQIWVDYNGDKKFDELVFQQKGDNESIVSGNINIPSTARGTTRLRVMMSLEDGTSACDRDANKEVEDFSINISGGTTVCNPPTNLRNRPESSSKDVIEYSAFWVFWDTIPGVDSYNTRMRPVGTTQWLENNTSNYFEFYWSIPPNTPYEFQVQSKCSNGSLSAWSPVFITTTLGAGDPYCYSYGISGYGDIDGFKFGETVFNSPFSQGFGNYTAQTAQAESGKSYDIELSANDWLSTGVKAANWRIWIDFNRDNDFTDQGELVFEGTGTNDSKTSGKVNIPTSASAGKSRMRIALDLDAQNGPCKVGGRREAEDFSIEIKSSTAAKTLTVSPVALNFDASAQTKTCVLTSNTTWSITESIPWLSVSPGSGSNNGSIAVVCEANTGTSARTGSITISGTGVANQTISVTQAGVSAILTASPDQLNFDEGAGSKSISISSNTSWVASKDADWISLSPASGNNNGSVSVGVLANPNNSERKAQITIRNASGSLVQYVTIIQASKRVADLPDSWNVVVTENNHTLILPNTLQSDIEGKTIQIGDHVGIFYPRDGKLVCAGEGEWAGSNTSFPVYGDDASTTIKDGFSTNEVFTVKVWQAATQQEYNAQAEYAPLGTNGIISATDRYLTDAISMITRLSAARTETLNIALKEGWNTISSYVVPTFVSLDSIFKPIKGIVQIAKDGAGKTYITTPPINGIGTWKIVEGYRVKVSNAGTLPIIGKVVDPAQTTITIRSGWQIIPFFGRNTKTLEQALASIKDKIEILKDNSGKVYIPDLSINTIGQLQPTQGYRLKAKSATELKYPSDFVNFSSNDPWAKSGYIVADTLQHFRLSTNFNTGSNATMVILNSAAAGLVQVGDEIGIFAADSILCGAGKYIGDNLAITVWGDDATENGRQGLFPGEPYRLRIWRQNLDKEAQLEASFGSNQGLYREDDIVLVEGLRLKISSSVKEAIQATAITLYPNPSNGSFQLLNRVALPGPVQIRVLNMNGQVLSQKQYPQGWMAGSIEPFNLSAFPNGVYQVQVRAELGWWNGKVSILR